MGWRQNLKWSHISGDLSSMVGTVRSLSPCVSYLQPQCSRRVRIKTAVPLLVRLATHFQGILLVKKVTSPAQKKWENWPYLWMGVVAKSLWPFLIYHKWPTLKKTSLGNFCNGRQIDQPDLPESFQLWDSIIPSSWMDLLQCSKRIVTNLWHLETLNYFW